MYPGEQAKQYPDRVAIMMADSGASLTYAEYEARSNRLAHFYRSIGLRQGDHVAYFTENTLGAFEAQGAGERTGLYYTLVNSHSSADEVAYIINDCHARVVITSWAKSEIAEKLPALCPGVERWLIIDAPAGQAPVGYQRVEDVTVDFPDTPVDDEISGGPMFYSSGTTGRPKGIQHDLPLVHPSALVGPMSSFQKNYWGFTEGQIYLSPAPLYHSSPQSSISGTLRMGGTAIVMEKFDPQRFLELVERYRVTNSQVVPTMFTRLLKLPEEVRARADVSSLEAVVHAAAPCPIPVKQAMIEWFGPILIEHAGSTEGVGICIATSAEWMERPGTVGRPIQGRAAAFDDEGNELAPGETGQIWYEQARSFEYFGDPAKTAESRRDSWATVGDIGHVDAEGYVFFTDRKSFMIISGGVNIYPQEIENVLVTHPKVMDAAVFGIPNEEFGEEVKAVIELIVEARGEAGPELEADLIAYCREHLARFKAPKSVDFVDALPRLETGKLYKKALRDSYWTKADATHG
jgi:long-chain acyl-CoA synthetase